MTSHGRGPRAGRRDAVAELEATERVFSALAHRQRRHILGVLHARGDRVRAGDIARRFDCSWPTTTRHLHVLEEAGLVTVEREGRERFYRLERAHLCDVVERWLGQFSGI